ncbi:serine/threonine-protein kinase [Candidatus Woesearchaeota archaeon]|nr:MAG: serine/threonine-protein kinase [Candidatus Woesearchaeota archaeon]
MTLDDKVKERILQTVELERRKTLVKKLYRDGLNHTEFSFRLGTVEALDGLAEVDKDLFYRVVTYLTGLDIDQRIRDAAMEVEKRVHDNVRSGRDHNLPLEVRGKQKGYKLFPHTVEGQNAMVDALPSLAQQDPEEFLRCYYFMQNFYHHALELFEKPDFFIRSTLYEHRLFFDEFLRKTAASLGTFAKTIFQEPILFIDDLEHCFYTDYLSSHYARGKTERELCDELVIFARDMSVVQNDTFYGNLLIALEYAKASDLEELKDCARYSSPGEQLVKRLGSGASGSTFLINSESFGKEMALKVFKPYPYFYSESELKILSDLQHPNIVRVWHGGERELSSDPFFIFHEDKTPGYIMISHVYTLLMDYVTGRTLEELIEDYPNGLHPEHLLDIAQQLLSAIQYLRSEGIFHRDLTLRNIKFDDAGTLKVIDFGIATDVQQKPRDNRKYGGPSDLFSWGLIIYKLATGKHLLGSKNPLEKTTDYAQAIQKIKQNMFEPDGALKKKYSAKLYHDILPLADAIIMALQDNDAVFHHTMPRILK